MRAAFISDLALSTVRADVEPWPPELLIKFVRHFLELPPREQAAVVFLITDFHIAQAERAAAR